MMRYKQISIMIVLMLVTCHSHAQRLGTTNGNNCFESFKKIIDSEKRFVEDNISKGRSWHLKYTLVGLVRQPGDQDYSRSVLKGEILANDKVRQIKEDDLEIFMDTNDIFTIDNDGQTIMRVASSKWAFEQKVNPLFDIYSEGFSEQYLFENCSEKYDSALGKKVTVFIIRPVFPSVNVFTKMRVYYDKEEGMVKRSECWYNPMKMKDVKMLAMTVDSRSIENVNDLSTDVKSKFLNSSGTLKNRYQKYLLKDYTVKR